MVFKERERERERERSRSNGFCSLIGTQHVAAFSNLQRVGSSYFLSLTFSHRQTQREIERQNERIEQCDEIKIAKCL